MKIRFAITAAALCATVMSFGPATFAQEDAMEEVVVTGIRSSLEAAADMKRNDSRIVDAVVAEDIGKLPDNNIAEALQRITGVSINRDFGIGDSVSIRGLPQNRVELNGRTTTGDDRDGISLQDYPSSFVSSVEVIKSPTADMIEGALGGTVRMNTVRPLDLDGFTTAGSFDYEYADKTEEWAPIVNVSAGNVWDLSSGGRFGISGNFSYQDRTIRQDEFFGRYEMFDFSDDLSFTSNGPGDLFQVRNQNTVEQYEEERERTALNVSFQWAPASEDGSVYLDFSMADRSGSQRGNSILEVGGVSASGLDSSTTQDGHGVLQNHRLVNTFVIPKTWAEFRDTRSVSSALGFDLDLSDSLTISGEVSHASSKSEQPDSEFNLRPLHQANHDAWVAQFDPDDAFNRSAYGNNRETFNLRNTFTLHQYGSGDKVPVVDFMGSDALTNPQNLALRQFIYEDARTTNDETAIRLDVDWSEAFGLEYLSSLKAGIRFTENTYEFTERQYNTGSNLYQHAFDDETGLPHVVFADEFVEMFPGTFTLFDHPNSFSQHGLSGRNDLLNYYIYDDLNNLDATFNRLQQLYEGTNFATAGSLGENLTLDQDPYRDITESTGALYVSAELDFDVVSAVVGVRYVTTDIESTVFVDGDLVTGTNDYNDVLPSLNATYRINDQTQVRFAAAKVMRRPNYTDLSSAFSVNGNITVADRGAIDLDPYRATQYDLSVEHYFENGGLLSFALFYKDVESFLKSTVVCFASDLTAQQNVTEWKDVCLLDTAGETSSDIRQADSTLGDTEGFNLVAGLRNQGLTGIRTAQLTNGENGTVEGWELGYQQHLDFLPGFWSGLGVSANYTYADSEQPNGNPLLEISENTFNVQVYWEGEAVSVRLAYNFRDKYLASEREKRVQSIGGLGLGSSTTNPEDDDYDPSAGNNYRDDRGQLDLSASWEINDTFTVVGNVTNLLEEPTTLVTEIGNTWRWIEADRRFSIGVRAKF